MKINIDDKDYKTIVNKYIDGKSFKSLKDDLIEHGLDDMTSIELLKNIHVSACSRRYKKARQDLIIALIFISLNVIPIVLLLTVDEFSFKFGMVSILALFAWRPFLKSYLRVKKDRLIFGSLK